MNVREFLSERTRAGNLSERIGAGNLAARTRAGTRAFVRALTALAPLSVIALFVVGALLRVALNYSYEPALLNFVDTLPYVSMANETLFADPARTSGYPIFLRIVHAVSADLDFTIALQHLLGLVTGGLIYASVRRIGAPVWAGLIGAAAVLLSLDQIAIEHTIASETVFTFLLTAAIYAAIRSLGDPRPLLGVLSTRHAWLLASGLLLGLSATVRAIGALLIPCLIVWALLSFAGRARLRIAYGALAAVPAIAVMLTYFSFNEAATGTFGLTQASGWAIYSRTAPFADCSEFTPPAGTSALCQTTPTDERPGPDFYTWQADSPAQELFGYPPAGNEKLSEFGRTVLLAQPLDYTGAVLTDVVRYFVPTFGLLRPFSGTGYNYLDIDRMESPAVQQQILDFLNAYYSPTGADIDQGASTLTDLQQVLRVRPLLLVQAVLIGILGFILARGRVRAAIALLTGAGLLMIVLSAATSSVHARYAIPADGPLAAGAALALWVLLRRYTDRDRARRAQ